MKREKFALSRRSKIYLNLNDYIIFQTSAPHYPIENVYSFSKIKIVFSAKSYQQKKLKSYSPASSTPLLFSYD